MDLELEGKVAIVTGGSDGIGKAAAASLAREGANVAIAARTRGRLDEASAEIERETGRPVLAVPTDVRNEPDVERLVHTVVERWGRLDVLVNNAGTSAARPFDLLTDEIVGEDFQVKVYGAVYCIRAALPHLRAAGGGAIVNVTTHGGKAPPAASNPTSMARAAGQALTKSLSKEFAADNVRVNTVCIGLVKSGQHRDQWAARNRKESGYSLDDHWASLAARVPLGRIGEAVEAGEVIAFLCSARASYVTGAAVNIDGGASPVL